MRIFYPFPFDPQALSGGTVHIRQFIANMEALGNRVVTRHGDRTRNDYGYPRHRIARLQLLRTIGVIYERLEERAPSGGWYQGFQRKFLKSPLIAWEFNTVPEFAEVLGRGPESIEREKRLLRQLAEYCDVAFCVSDALSEYARAELGVSNAITVPNGSDLERFSPDLNGVRFPNQSASTVNVVWMGSASLGWHDFDLVRRAALELLHSDLRELIAFHILGEGFQATTNLPKNISYHGAVRYEDLPRWLAACDIGLLSYKPGPAAYGSPLKLFDYLSAGLAVVSTEQPQVRQVLEELGCASNVAPLGDDRHVARVLADLTKDRTRMNALGRAGRHLVATRYTWKHNALRIQDELDRLIGARAPKRLTRISPQ